LKVLDAAPGRRVADVEAEALSNDGQHPKTINGLDTCTSREPPDGCDSSKP
jgi:hypothetical protein